MKYATYSIRKFTGLVFLFALSICTDVYAHGWILDVSTPISPPEGLYLLIPPLFMIGFIIVNRYLIRRHNVVGNEDDYFIGLSTFVYFIAALIIALIIGNALFFITGGNFPRLGYGDTVLYGLDEPAFLILFAVFNGLAAAIFLDAVRRLSMKYEIPTQKFVKRLLPVNLLLYIVFLLPYVLTGAFVSGYEGGYVSMSCRANIRRLGGKLVTYAKHHKGTLPDHTSMERLAEELYEDDGQERYGKKSIQENIVCSLEAGYKEDPALYHWNQQLAGRSMQELKRMEPATPVITCRYHLNAPRGRNELIVLCVGDLLDAYGGENGTVEFVNLTKRRTLYKQDVIEMIENGSH